MQIRLGKSKLPCNSAELDRTCVCSVHTNRSSRARISNGKSVPISTKLPIRKSRMTGIGCLCLALFGVAPCQVSVNIGAPPSGWMVFDAGIPFHFLIHARRLEALPL
jgi:hypothetical protein